MEQLEQLSRDIYECPVAIGLPAEDDVPAEHLVRVWSGARPSPALLPPGLKSMGAAREYEPGAFVAGVVGPSEVRYSSRSGVARRALVPRPLASDSTGLDSTISRPARRPSEYASLRRAPPRRMSVTIGLRRRK